MSDQHPAVAFLLSAHRAALELAQATTPVPLAGQWTVVRDKDAARTAPLALVQGVEENKSEYESDGESYSYGLPVIVLAADWQTEAEANLRHIALHDPRSVLRRVEADRELLAVHQPEGGVFPDRCPICITDRSDWTENWDYDRAPCTTVLLIAKGWGWAA